MNKLIALLGALSSLFGLNAAALAGEYPTDKAVVMVVPFAAGGPTDKVARELGVVMTKHLKQIIVVDNTVGAGGTIGARKVVQAPKDGYTILLHHIGMSTSPALYRNLGFDPMNDYEFIGEVADVPMLLLSTKSLTAKDFKELLPYIKANHDKLSLANAGIGSASHLCGLLFMSTIQADFTTVPYKGTAPALTDLMGGQVQLMCDQTTNVAGQVRSKAIKAYGATSLSRLTAFKDIPTLDEQGLKGFEVKIWHAMYAPKGTPKPVVDKLVAALQASVQDASFRAKMAELGAEVATPQRATPDSARALVQSEINKWTPIIKKAGVYAD
ncbi:MAG: tripartite tricarboxylate transporter substrate binding protein BugD [Candidatus Protistobacter heckmanni]|nr:tripartite tricarboxylate transporter substrate binding protein BugD [Candidatus Protistobacter heckmanni]